MEEKKQQERAQSAHGLPHQETALREDGSNGAGPAELREGCFCPRFPEAGIGVLRVLDRACVRPYSNSRGRPAWSIIEDNQRFRWPNIMSKAFKRSVFGISVALVVIVFLGGFISGGVSAGSQSDGVYRQMGVYEEVLHKIQSDYVTEPNINQVTT